MDISMTQQVLLWGFGIAVVMGAVVNKTNFCTMGAVSDWVNMGDKSRFRAWLLAVAVALLGVVLIEASGLVSVDSTLPPYRTAGFAWLRYLVGGFLFGIGMTLASGCGNKTLIRIGGGNIKSIVVLIVAGFFAYLMTKTAFYEKLFHGWVTATTINLNQYGIPNQDIGAVIGSLFGVEDLTSVRTVVGVLVILGLLAFIFKSADFRRSKENIISGVVIGLAVLAGWYVTGGPMGQQWIEGVEWLDQKPINVAVQSFTFINPMGEVLTYAASGFNSLLISFGVASLFGVIVGSFLYAVFSKNFRIEWFNSFADFMNHFAGAILMGIGGVLAMGCTIGQGVTGMSTLAMGSVLSFVSIAFGSALTMKVNYYKLVYEDEATFGKALVTSLVDLRVLPGSMRKLDAV